MSERKCFHCQSEIAHGTRVNSDYCSSSCLSLARYHMNKPDAVPLAPRNCHWCENSFIPPVHDSAKYCCARCRIDAMNEESRKRKAEARKLVPKWEPTPRFCAECGISFVPKNTGQKYHSQECMRAAAKARAQSSPRRDYVPVPPKQLVAKKKPKPRVWVVKCDTVEDVQEYYGLYQREPAKPVAKSLAECEAMKGT